MTLTDQSLVVRATEWLRNNYQNHANIDSLCSALATFLYTAPAANSHVNAAPAGEPSLIEAVAKAIYQQWNPHPDYVPWVDGGNSFKQDDARSIARAALYTAPAASLRDAEGLDDAFDVAQAALFMCPDRASVREILATLRARIDSQRLGREKDGK